MARLNEFSMIKRLPENLDKLSSFLIDKTHFSVEKKECKIIEPHGLSAFFIKILKGHSLIMHPFSNFNTGWYILHFFMMLFCFFFIPIDLAFELQFSIPIRLILSLFILLDNFMGFSTAIFQQGEFIRDRNKIAKNYLNFFILDIIIQICLNSDLILVHEIFDIPKKEWKVSFFFI